MKLWKAHNSLIDTNHLVTEISRDEERKSVKEENKYPELSRKNMPTS
jgi:hypothetical protein